jgi:hypothetical protein
MSEVWEPLFFAGISFLFSFLIWSVFYLHIVDLQVMVALYQSH